MNVHYTCERNIQMLIYLLKKNNIKRIIASPGTTNIGFVMSIQNDPFFEVYSCVDERSACYMACGLAGKTNEPVVLTCTGATASRNYMPGLTEAYYRKLPILVLTSALHVSKIGHNLPQIIDRTQPLKDIVNYSVTIPSINTPDDGKYANIEINKSLIFLKKQGGGPVHINMTTICSKVFDVEEIKPTRVIKYLEYNSKFPEITKEYSKIAIFIGNHISITKDLEKSIECFCEKYNSVVLCDHTSNYNGKYKILPNLICDQEKFDTELIDIDLLIHIGNISGSYVQLRPKNVWRISEDGKIIDTFGSVKYIFSIYEKDFFDYYNESIKQNTKCDYFDRWNCLFEEIEEKVQNIKLPFSNLYVARAISKKIPSNSNLHLAILNSLRSWNYFKTNSKNIVSNTGGFGIDGALSTLIGTSLADKNTLCYGIVGDLAFFYDMNAIGNRFVGNNIRLIVLNNGCGTEFHNYSHPASQFGDGANDYIAADGHFGNKSKTLIKELANSLGFDYISATNEIEFENNVDKFMKDNNERSIIFEIFTNSKDESDALRLIRTQKKSFKKNLKYTIKNVMSNKSKEKLKKIIKK